jgi:hypothetical protein
MVLTYLYQLDPGDLPLIEWVSGLHLDFAAKSTENGDLRMFLQCKILFLGQRYLGEE